MAAAVKTRDIGSRAAWLWTAAFLLGMIGTPLVVLPLRLGLYPTLGIMVLPMLLLIPMAKAYERRAREKGCASPAMKTYNRRFLVASFTYVAALFAAIGITNALEPAGVLAWLLAMLPALPITGMLWVMGRYLIEEQDEYLRSRAIGAALIATGLLLTLATFWGFLETFELVPHAPGWWAVPVWSLGLGVGHALQGARG
jgi:hypothetical protein